MNIKTLVYAMLAAVLVAAAGCNTKEPVHSAKAVITALEPPVVASGQTAQIIGKGLPSEIISDLEVIVGGIRAEILSCSPTAISIRLPDLKDGLARVVVRCRGQVFQGLSFTVINADADDSSHTLIRMRSCSIIREIVRDTVITLSSGIYDTEISAVLTDGQPASLYVVSIDMKKSGAALKLALPGNVVPTLDMSSGIPMGWKRATLTQMATAMDGKSGNVVAMFNGDFWNTNSIIPKGPVHFRGNVVSSNWDHTEEKPQQGVNYVGIDAAGSMVIGPTLSYEADAQKYRELSGAGMTVVEDGKAVATGITTDYPRCGVGYTPDGVVHFLVADGSSALKVGISHADMSQIFIALGCDKAANLDGGGSAQILVRDPQTSRFQIRNKPCDGAERPVINGWAITL